MKTFKSKVGLELVLFIGVINIGLSILLIVDKIWIGLLINIFVALLLIYMFTSIKYIISDNDLIIKCVFLRGSRINIETIKKIRETNNPLSAPAASFDRLEILYNKYDSVLVSPRNKKVFINQLLTINSKIEVIYKEDKKL